jgi:DNA mismatch repair ATPase MutS
MAYLEHIAPLRKSGLKFCYPEMTTLKAEIDAKDVFDLALARKLLNKDAEIVLNNFNLRERECVMVVSGPNQGGKTTFARAFGQTHYLAKLGLPVPGARARLLLCDKILTHFEREEEISNLRGKLQDDLTRINELLRKATENSIIILNEIFNSTTLKDGVFLGERILGKIAERGSICLLVTFMEELSRGKNGDGEPTGERISLVSVVHPDNPAGRTYKIVRKPADGRAYAQVMAEKHHLTYEEVKKRIQRGVED